MLNKKLLEVLHCIKSYEVLSYSDIDNDFLLSLASIFHDEFNEKVDGFLINQSNQYFYPVCQGVVIIMEGFFFDSNSKLVGESKLNPFTQHEETDSNWYDNYANVVSFKNSEIKEAIRDYGLLEGAVVEYMSSSGALIIDIYQEFKGVFNCFIAIDADFIALKKLNKTENHVSTICCDATKNIFKENSIAVSMSNSVHHIPEHTNKFYKNIYSSLVDKGMFVGIESQGVLAKWLINIINILPEYVIPYTFKEVHVERALLSQWLKTKVLDRLRFAGIDKNINLKSYMFHIRYLFNKNGL